VNLETGAALGAHHHRPAGPADQAVHEREADAAAQPVPLGLGRPAVLEDNGRVGRGDAGAAYVKALDSEKGIYNPTGIMPTGGPETCRTVLSSFNPAVKGKTIDVSKTYTDEFVKAAV
jgi:hypothetical protein